MRGVPNPKLKEECIRLRVEGRLSLREIHARTGAPKGSLSGWLKPHPLTKEEKDRRCRRQARYTAPKKDRGTESALHRLANVSALSSLQKAKISESAAMLRMCLHDINVFGSVFDGDRTDWLAETPAGKIWKIQVKWAAVHGDHGLPRVGLLHSSKNHPYKDGDFDFLVGYDLYTDTCYVWFWKEIRDYKACVTVHPEAAERWDKLLD